MYNIKINNCDENTFAKWGQQKFLESSEFLKINRISFRDANANQTKTTLLSGKGVAEIRDSEIATISNRKKTLRRNSENSTSWCEWTKQKKVNDSRF